MPKLNVVFPFLALTLVTACTSGTNPLTSPKPLSEKAQFAKRLAANPWCLVETQGQPYSGTSSIAVIYRENGEAESRRFQNLTGEGLNGQIMASPEKANWKAEGGVVTVYREGQVIAVHQMSFVEFTPALDETTFKVSGVMPGKQTCLKNEDPNGKFQPTISCACTIAETPAGSTKTN